MKRRRRRQRSIEGGRLHGSTGFDPVVWAALQRECARWNCSLAFVLTTMAADCLGIDLEQIDRYDQNKIYQFKRKAG